MKNLKAGFTLVELLVSTAIIALIMVILVQITGQTSSLWRYTSAKSEQFREARNAFEAMTRRISQATLNTYWDYNNAETPTQYERRSELRLASGPMQYGSSRLDLSTAYVRPTHGIFFQGPFGFVAPARANDPFSMNYEGLDNLINTWGYYLEVGSDKDFRPPFIKTPERIRSRLMEMREPTGGMSLYWYTSGRQGINPTQQQNYRGFDWFRNSLPRTAPATTDTTAKYLETRAHPIAENIIAIAILPKLSDQELRDDTLSTIRTRPPEARDAVLAPRYFYHTADAGQAASLPNSPDNNRVRGMLNSKHQLPPVIQVTMVAIDEPSAQRLNYREPTDDPLRVRDSSFLVDAQKLKQDLLTNNEASDSSLEAELIRRGLNYRIFTTNIHLRAAKWSQDQLN